MTYDAIVLGLGGMGAAAASALARRGMRVLGLEQFDRGHDRGSSHGQTRIIRTAYYEHPDYVPLCQASFGLWHDLEQRTGRHLLTGCPCLSLGSADSELIEGVRAAAAQHQLAVTHLKAGDLRARYPQFRLGDEIVGTLEAASGLLLVDHCVDAMLDDAAAHGAELRFGEAAVEWRSTHDRVAVRTSWETLAADRLVVAAGPWSARLLADLNLPLSVMRQCPLWFRAIDPAAFRRDRFPIFIADGPAGAYYGLPMIDGRGVKVARHYGAPELASPEGVSRDVSDADERPVRAFLNGFLPNLTGPRTSASVCLYTLTPDRHFIIDQHPYHANVAVAAGFSGHGFKFAPVIGEALADLLIQGRTEFPINRFALGRFVLARTSP